MRKEMQKKGEGHKVPARFGSDKLPSYLFLHHEGTAFNQIFKLDKLLDDGRSKVIGKVGNNFGLCPSWQPFLQLFSKGIFQHISAGNFQRLMTSLKRFCKSSIHFDSQNLASGLKQFFSKRSGAGAYFDDKISRFGI